MEADLVLAAAAARLRELRLAHRISQRALADFAGMKASQISRLERGRNARLSTWVDVFGALGARLRLEIDPVEEESPEHLAEESEQRRERRREGLCTGKRRYY